MRRRADARFTVGVADQRAFARFSGDFNPIHLDRVYARRTIAGEPVVHGFHLLLRALDIAGGTLPRTNTLTLDARFLAPLFVGEPIEVRKSPHALELLAGVKVAEVTVETSGRSRTGAGRPLEGRRSRGPERPALHQQIREPEVHTLEDLAGAHGVVAIEATGLAQRLFPRASRWFGAGIVAALARLSNIVGMRCPGRDSLLSSAQLDIARNARPSTLQWHVARVDRRFGLVRIAVHADGITGTIDAFLRPAVVDTVDLPSVVQRVRADEFSGQRALIIGGSRGLGAAASAIVACGGGAALLTYAVGAEEADTLVRSLAAAGRNAAALKFDVNGDTRALIEAAAAHGTTHVYYFATPKIFARRVDPFDQGLYHRFSTFYVDAFARLCQALDRIGRPLTIFYPSTTAIDEPVRELTEYAAAKAAGEAIGRMLAAALPKLDVVSARLPRVATDQTRSLVSVPACNAVDALIPIVREMHRRAAGSQDHR